MLYIVATPIGNLDDLSIRQAKVLTQSDIILAEDTRTCGHLLQKIKELFGYEKKSSLRLISYYKEKEFEKLPEIINLIEEGKTISLISESGMPLISDPGYLLVKTLIKKNLPFCVIPGPSALTTALVYSGFPVNQFLFLGFLPKKPSAKTRLINRLSFIAKELGEVTVVFYESGLRISETLKIINDIMPQTQVVIAREMTKFYEEIIRGKPQDLLNRSFKGELTVVLSFT